jgi:hypothetical protein
MYILKDYPQIGTYGPRWRNGPPAVKIVRQLRRVRVGERMVDVMPRGDLWLGRDGRGKRNDFQNSNGFSPFFNSNDLAVAEAEHAVRRREALAGSGEGAAQDHACQRRVVIGGEAGRGDGRQVGAHNAARRRRAFLVPGMSRTTVRFW